MLDGVDGWTDGWARPGTHTYFVWYFGLFDIVYDMVWYMVYMYVCSLVSQAALRRPKMNRKAPKHLIEAINIHMCVCVCL